MSEHAQNTASGTKRVVHISTNIGSGCDHCDSGIGGEAFAESVNHYIKEHGYRVLHVGQQSSRDDSGALYHSTVAVLGSDDPPPVRELPKTFTFEIPGKMNVKA